MTVKKYHVYKIVNLINNKAYIGQTISKVNKRWTEHLYESKKGSTAILHNAIRKYGKNNFVIKKICWCCNMDDLNHREEYYIRLFKTLAPNGYNAQKGGGNRTTCEESRLKNSKAKGGKPFLVRDLVTDRVMEFKNQHRCSRKLNCIVQNINHCLKGERYSSNGYSFVYVEDRHPPLTKKEIELISKTNMVKGQGGSSFMVRNLETNEITEFNNQSECSRQLDIRQSQIYRCLNKKDLQAKGYSFCHKVVGKLPLTKDEIKEMKKR